VQGGLKMVENKGAFCIAIRVQKMLEAAGYDIRTINVQPHFHVKAALNLKIIFDDQYKKHYDINILFLNTNENSTRLHCIAIFDNLQKYGVAKQDITHEQIDILYTEPSSEFNQTVAQLIVNKIQSIISEKQKEN
jgi:hypothetical protein